MFRPLRVALAVSILCGAGAGRPAGALAEAGRSPVGLWRVYDDQTGSEAALVRIYSSGGRLFGRIERLLDPAARAETCGQCRDDRRGRPLAGLVILRGLSHQGEGWSGGDILDPRSGGIYRASLKLAANGSELDVRGYIGAPVFGRSQTWRRAQ